jgi:hypothetical protein
MRIRPSTVVLLVGAITFLSAGSAYPLTATTADDVCASDADPCNITEPVDVADGAVLDFQARTVNVTGAGQLNFGADSGTILSGAFHAATSGPAIRSRVTVGSGQTDSGNISISARRLCSDGDSTSTCETSSGCQLGTCGAYRCSGNALLQCTSDGDCEAGPCEDFRCLNTLAYRFCTTDAECDFGSCGSQTTCQDLRGASAVPCADDTDCDLGTCSVGEGAITIAGDIDGRSDYPARVTLRAAGSVGITGEVELSSTSEYEAGRLFLRALDGNASVGGKVRAKNRNAGPGGHVSINASQDALISAPIDLVGDNFEDGIVEVTAGRDVTIAASINVGSRTNGGWGGLVTAVAGRDILIDGNERVVLRANGAGSSYFSDDGGGNGGLVELYADGDVTIAEDVRILANGAVPAGAGGSLFVEAEGDVELSGRISANSSGTSGGWLYVYSRGDVTMNGRFSGQSFGFDNYGWGGYAEIYADGDLAVSESGDFSLIGVDGGTLEARIRGSVDFRGHVDASGRKAGYGGYVDIYSDRASVDVSGIVETGGEGGEIYINACSVGISGTLSNSSSDGWTGLTAFNSLTVLAGSSVRTPRGVNQMRYGHADNPPVILGNVSPAAQISIGAGAADCP